MCMKIAFLLQLNFQEAFTEGHTWTKCSGYLSKLVVEVNSIEFLCSALGDSLCLL